MLATHSAREFEHRWLHGRDHLADVLLGAADIQSLADPSRSSELLRDMRIVPLIGAAAPAPSDVCPVLPLALAVSPFMDLVQRVLEMLT